MNDLEIMTPEHTQDTVVFSYWMNITPGSHNSVFCWKCGHMEPRTEPWVHAQLGQKRFYSSGRENRDQHIIYRMTVNVCEQRLL